MSPDCSGNPFEAGVQPQKITSSIRYRSGAAKSGTLLPEKPYLPAPKLTDSVTYFHKKIPKTSIGIWDFVYLKWNGLQLKCFFRIVIAKQLHWIF
jgi:hypothetical protein